MKSSYQIMILFYLFNIIKLIYTESVVEAIGNPEGQCFRPNKSTSKCMPAPPCLPPSCEEAWESSIAANVPTTKLKIKLLNLYHIISTN